MIRITTSFLLLFLLAGCGKDNSDETEPVVELFTVNGEVARATATNGSNLSIAIEVSDDQDLKQLRVTVEDSLENDSENVFATTRIENIEGTFVSLDMNFPITGTAGIYNVKAEALDQQGNLSDAVYVILDLTDASQPVINVTSPDFSSPYVMNAGDTLFLSGDVTEDVALAYVDFQIDGGDVFRTNYTNADSSFSSFDLTTLASDSNWITLPAGTTPGSYPFLIEAKDEYGHISRFEATIDAN